jgi:hypothetical protein
MKKLIIFALIVIAAWQAWKRYPELISRRPSNEAVVENAASDALARVRLSVGGQTFVREELPAGQTAVFRFRVNQDATFELNWEVARRMGEMQWRGGRVSAGPLVARHVMTVQDDGGVIYRAESLTPSTP